MLLKIPPQRWKTFFGDFNPKGQQTNKTSLEAVEGEREELEAVAVDKVIIVEVTRVLSKLTKRVRTGPPRASMQQAA